MNIDKAIEILTTILNEDPSMYVDDEGDALRLSIEALEFFKEFQKVTGSHQDARLPSETKE